MTMGRTIGKSLGLLPIYFLCISCFYPVLTQDIVIYDMFAMKSELGGNATVVCSALPPTAEISWYFADKPVNNSDRIKIRSNTTVIKIGTEIKESTLFFSKTVRDDAGNYTCVASYNGRNVSRNETLDLSFPAKFVSEKLRYEVNNTLKDHGHNETLECIFDMYYKPDTMEWRHEDTTSESNTTWVNDRHVKGTFYIEKVGFDDNGIHECTVWDKVQSKNVTGKINLIVYGDPEIEISVQGISKSQLFVNWTIDPANSVINRITLSLLIDKSYIDVANKRIETNTTSFVINNLNKSTEYEVRLEVETDHSLKEIRRTSFTLDEDPVFVPNISINGFSATSVTIGWAPPPEKIAPYIHYYLLEAQKKDVTGASRKAYHSRDSRNLPYMFDNLEPHSTYFFKVRACQDFTKECGNWSETVVAATLDGIPGRPSKVTSNCTSSNMVLSWAPPEKPNAEIKGYTIELTGSAEYRDRSGAIKKETWGPLSRFKTNDSTNARFDDLQPNTNYTVKLSAMTRTRRRGEEETVYCKTLPAPPDSPPRPRWRKILEKDRYLFKMSLPKVSERNGPICCYRVYMVRLTPGTDLRSISQSSLEIIDYEEAHPARPIPGAYITDIFTNDNFPVDNEIILGDGHSIFNYSDPTFHTEDCERCVKRPHRAIPETPAPKLATTTATTTEEDEGITDDPVEGSERERRAIEERKSENVTVKDGPLDSTANYTVFVELIPFPVEKNQLEPMYSDYLNQLMPAPSPVAPVPSTALEIALQVTCAVAAVVLLIMIIFCVMQTRRSRKLPPHANMEMNRFPKIIRYIWPVGRQPLVSHPPADMPPIAQEDLPAAYAERHADSDYGFQKEFEMLSECFPDRTTHASEARENQPKNRYPDIKAYDQTRVKLSQIDGITGSDYINANYVMGYKERKKFICAQGPTDTTVNDFWRMIWEHGLELIVMLTNLEEYSKVKCSKYWPDEVRGSRAFGGITVQHVSEKRYSDYIVRELKITKQPTNADGQPIVENGGAKRNGDIREGSESVPTSPRDTKECSEARIVRQYHFLMWKDFNAPEHPHAILKFIKRVNEAWTNMVGRPVVVHCSAGVGRTGTLVALDCLLEQLKATGQVTVFNTIAELRRQRNFLVQSQKQYVFVYRALVEYGHYGDTEIPASRLKTSIDRLRNTPEGADKCLMEHDFEKMMDSPVVEAVKSCAAAQADEVRSKNRSAECLPYDRNRVMLTPIPGRDYSTYINASFVEAYDNSEGFIITQDPLPNTIFDFWRMVSEQSVSTIVMLSELGEGKCPRYWDDGTAQYEHMSVQYEDSESCPYYTRRQFRLTNNKTGHTSVVRQLQYQGWPTAPGHVPEVTRGLAELADAVSNSTDTLGPMLVHCNLGTERSALFVALCILICQLRTERRVDVSAVARKVRSQRSHTIDTFLQYEFLHRAILNYAELHNLLEDS